MSLRDYQKQVDDWAQDFQTPYWTPLSQLARLTEEVGEVARVYNHKYGERIKKSSEEPDDLEGELGDVIFSVICMANKEGIDLDDALQKVINKSKTRDADRFEKKKMMGSMADSLMLQSPFYRVTVKALIFDQAHRLMVTQTKGHRWELPGGGWEHEEALEDCIRREIQEELGGTLASIGAMAFTYRGKNRHGWVTLRLAFPVTLKSHNFTSGDDMITAQFVTEDELVALPMSSDEAPIKDHIRQIWPAS